MFVVIVHDFVSMDVFWHHSGGLQAVLTDSAHVTHLTILLLLFANCFGYVWPIPLSIFNMLFMKSKSVNTSTISLLDLG